MKTGNVKRSMFRVVGVAAIGAALLGSGGNVGAAPREVGLSACDYEGCAIVTIYDLTDKGRSSGAQAHSTLPGGAVGLTE